MANRLTDYEKDPLLPGTNWPLEKLGVSNMQDRLGSLMNQASRWIVDHPEIAITTAVVTGVVLGWLIKRR